MDSNLEPKGGDKKSYTIGDRSDVTVDKSMKDHSNDPYALKLLADASRSFAESNFGRDQD